MPKLPKVTTFSNQSRLAKRIAVSGKTMSEWLRRADWPVNREPPWTEEDALEVEIWRKTNLKQNLALAPTDPASIAAFTTRAQAEIDVLIERRDTLRLKREILSGKFVDRATEHQRKVRLCHLLRTGLMQLVRRIETLCGQDAGDLARTACIEMADALPTE